MGVGLLESRSKYVLAPFLLIDGVLVFGLIMLWELDWLVNNTLYSYNLVFSVDWAVPYWTFLRIVAGSFLLAIAAVTFWGCVSYRQARKKGGMPTYVCRKCGSIWMTVFDGARAGKVGESRRIKFLKSCPLCDQNLLAE